MPAAAVTTGYSYYQRSPWWWAFSTLHRTWRWRWYSRCSFQSTISTLSQAELLHFLSQLSEFFRSWSKRSTISPASARFFSIQVPQKSKTMLKRLHLVQLPSTIPPPSYPLRLAYSDPWNYNPFAASFGLKNGSGGGESDYQRQRLQAFTFGGTPGGSSTSENRFFALEVYFRFVKAPSTIEFRGYQITIDALH